MCASQSRSPAKRRGFRFSLYSGQILDRHAPTNWQIFWGGNWPSLKRCKALLFLWAFGWRPVRIKLRTFISLKFLCNDEPRRSLADILRCLLDWDFILRAQASGFRFKRLPRFLGCFRVHDEQKTTAMMEVGHNKQRQLRRIHLGRDPTGPEVDRAIRPYLRRHVLFHRLYKLKLLNY